MNRMRLRIDRSLFPFKAQELLVHKRVGIESENVFPSFPLSGGERLKERMWRSKDVPPSHSFLPFLSGGDDERPFFFSLSPHSTEM